MCKWRSFYPHIFIEKHIFYFINIVCNAKLYLTASNDITKPVEQNSKYVIKIEPHNNGPLFVEMNFYIRAARKPMSKEFSIVINKHILIYL